jgi:FdhE protein
VAPRPTAQPTRTEPREVIELRHLRTAHPELETAVDLQIELLALHRRVQGRVTVPSMPPQEIVADKLAHGRPVLQFGDIPLSWTEFRYVLRETTELLRRFDLIEADADQALHTLLREGNELEPVVQCWFGATQRTHGERAAEPLPQDVAPFEQVFTLAMRPFLARCADAILPRIDLEAWHRGYCPLCGADPEFAVIAPTGERLLICGRCTGRWPFSGTMCPFCGNDDRLRLTTLGSRDGRYRIGACDVCLRYVKAYDERGATRPVMLVVDTIATLPLDAAAMQRGYQG